MFKFYFIYVTRNEQGEISSMGFSRFYDSWDEMWENLDFQRLCGFECRPKVSPLEDLA